MSEETTETPELEPLAVKLVGSEQETVADWGSFQTFIVLPATQPQQILAENPHRKNAYIIVFGSATGFVRVGTRGQVSNNQGGQLPAGQYKYESRQEVIMGGDGVTATMTVTVLDHRYK